MPQSQPWKQSGFSEMQLLQQQVMLKQMQEMQRQQQFQSFSDTRQHSGTLKNIDGVQYSPVINGTPVHSTSNMFTNWGQHTASPSVQGMSQLASGQDHRSSYGVDGVRQYDGSSHDSPIPGAGSNLNQTYFQGISSGSPMQQQQQPVAPTLGFTHSFSGGQNLDSSNQTFSSRQDYSRSNVYEQVHQKLSQDSTFGSVQHVNVLPKNAMAYEINENEHSGWPLSQLENKSMHISPSRGSTTLDPLEEKILFSMDDNLRHISSGKCTEVGTRNPGNALGSWSALMQSALAETSSSDTVLQEEWSGLTFQNTDPSAGNQDQTSKFVESGHQQAECVENSMQPASALSVTEYQYLNSPGMNFTGFHQAVTNNQSEHDGSLHSAHEHNQMFSKIGGRFGSNHQQLSQIVGMTQSQTTTQAKHGWASPSYERAESNPNQLHLTATDQQTNNTDFWSEQKAHSGTSTTFAHNNFRMNSFPSGFDSGTTLVSAENQNQNQNQNQENNQPAYAYLTNTANMMRDSGTVVNRHVSNNIPQVFDDSFMHSNLNATKLSSQGRPESNAVDNSMMVHTSNMSSQGSQNVIQLLQNINQSREEGTLVHAISISQGQITTAAAVAQYNSQNGSQSSSLSPSPSQRYPSHNIMDTSQKSWQKSGNPVISSSVPYQSQLHWQQISRSVVGSQPIQTGLYSAATGYANAIASSHQSFPGSTHANLFTQQHTCLGAHPTSQPSMTSNLSQGDMFPSKPINQWTDVPIQKNSSSTKSELVKGSGLSDNYVEEVIGYPQNLNEQETEHVTPSGLSAKPDIYEEEKSHPRILSEVRPESVFQSTSEIQESEENQARFIEKNSSMNQMNILYGNLGDTVWSTNAVAITRPNKRKLRTSELFPWHKEVAKVSITFPYTRMGEQDWAQATNQLMEVTNEAELLKFGKAIIRPRKRLIMTTRLMQTLLRPAPRTILSIDAASAYECVAYIVARLSLGDACNMRSARAQTDLANKSEMQEKSNLDKVLDNFIKRIKRLEDVLQRSEEIHSIVDRIVEYQDLERFSVINRFAKFHSRAQPNPSEPFSSGSPKMYPQRYVSAFPMPKEIPDGLPCISL